MFENINNIRNINIALIIIIILLLKFMNKSFETLYKNIDICFLFIDKQLDLQELSELYILTGKKSYLDKFNNILDASNGNISWNSLKSQGIMFSENKINHENILKQLELRDEENELYKKISKQEKDILWSEIQSINWYQGLFDKDDVGKKEFYSENYDGKFIIFKEKTAEDKKKALENLLTPEKIELSKSLDENLRNFRDIVVNRQYKKFNYVKNILSFILILFIAINILYFSKVNGNSEWFPILKTSMLFLSFSVSYLGFSNINSKELRYNSYIMSRIVKIIRDRLTFYTRKYVLTGDKKYFDEYWKIVNVQNGKEKWEYLNNLKSSINLKTEDSLENLYKILSGFTDVELATLKQAQNDSDSLIWNDNQAFNWKNKNWDIDNDGKNTFNNSETKKFVKFSGTEKDSNSPKNMEQMSNDIVYSDEYITLKDRIEQYLDKAILNINKRISTSEILTNKIFILFLFFYVISFITTELISTKQK